MMRITRVYGGNDGESHFEDPTPDQAAEIVNRRGEGPINLRQRPSDYFSDYHKAPRRRYAVIMAGRAELEGPTGASASSGRGTLWLWRI